MKLDVPKVTSMLRKRLRKMSAGDALPGVRVLMKEYGVSQSLVQQAALLLKQEGLIEAYDGKGTYVTAKGTLRRVLWVCGIDIFHGDISPYFSHVLRSCKAACAEHDLSLDHLWLSNFRPEDSEQHCTPDIFDRYEGYLFCGCAEGHRMMNYIRQYHAPFSTMTHYLSTYSHRVVTDMPHLLKTGFEYLKSKGHRSIDYMVCEDSIYNEIRYDAAKSAGIELRQLLYPLCMWSTDIEIQAYLMMCKEIKTNGLPKALLIQDDVAAKGATRAIIELCDNSMIEKLDLVVACTRQTIIPLGIEAAYLVMDITKSVNDAVDILCAQFDEKSHTHETVITEKCKLVTDLGEITSSVRQMAGYM